MSSAVEQLASGFNFSTFAKAEDLKKRILFTLAALVVYRFGTYIPLPGINPEIIREFTQNNAGGILGILDMFSGGAIGRMTIFALNIMPYISASIIVQLLTSVSPHLEALKKEGEAGRRKLNQYTRYGTVALACVQAFGIAVGLEKITGYSGAAVLTPGLIFKISTIVTLTGGTLFIMWLGEQITSRGIGNGISLIIYSGIVANLPQAVVRTFILGREGDISTLLILAILLMVAAVIGYIVFMEKAQRRILIQYPKRQVAADRPATSQSTHLPLKLNSSGVIPPIFASSLLLFPATIGSFSGAAPDTFLGMIGTYLSHGSPIYIMLFVTLIIFFAFFYTAIVFNPTETAENLRKMGTFIPGIRPGKPTANFIDYVLTRLTVVGALYLASICVLPELILAKVSLPFYFGGTSLLIVVSVTIDTIGQLQSHLVAHQYEGLIKKAKLKEDYNYDSDLFGPPGSGKGTQSQHLVDNMDFQHISTGDLLRNEIKLNTDIGNQVKEIMGAGLYVPDDIIIKIVDSIIAAGPDKNYIFDGFPRTLNQALAMEHLLGVRHLKVDLVIDFSVNLEELVERISGRFSCATCGTVYHDKFNKPKVAGICNKCQGTSFVRRQDDDETVVKRRIEVYLKETEVVRDYYTDKGTLVTINASKNLDDVKSNIEDCLSQVGFTF